MLCSLKNDNAWPLAPEIPLGVRISERSWCKVKGLTLPGGAAVYGAATRFRVPQGLDADRHGEEAPNDRSSRKPGWSPPAATPKASTASSIPPSITPRPCSIRPPRTRSRTVPAINTAAAARRPPRRWRTRSHARRRRLRRRRPDAVGPGGDLDRLARDRRFRRPHPGHRQRLPADAQFLRRPVQAHGRRDHLLRSADRRGHRQAVQAEHQGGVRRGARLAKLRDAGHSGHRQGRRTTGARSC